MSIWSVLDHYLGFLDHNLEFSHREIFGDVNLTGGFRVSRLSDLANPSNMY